LKQWIVITYVIIGNLIVTFKANLILMSTNKHAQIRYLTLDKCFSNFGRKYYIEDLVEACNTSIYEFTGKHEGVKKRQVYEDIKFMESSQG
jgi:hypothetical protein